MKPKKEKTTMMEIDEQAAAHEKLWADVEFKDALRDIVSSAATGYPYAELAEMVKDEENDDGLTIEELEDVDKTVNLTAHLFTYFGSKRLGKEFATLPMHQQMTVVGGIIHAFTAGLPEGAAFAEVKMENSNWQCILVKKNSGFEKEVDALIAASEEE